MIVRFKMCPHDDCTALNEVPQSLLRVEGEDTQQEVEMICGVPGGCKKKFFASRDRSEVPGVRFSENPSLKIQPEKVARPRLIAQTQFRTAQG